MINLNSIMIGTTNFEEMSAFYAKVLGRKPDMDDGGYHGWKAGSCFLSIGKHSKVTGKNQQGPRIMFNFETTDVKGEFERIKECGAEVIAEPYTMEGWEGVYIATLADPDGNYFQLMPPWDETPEGKQEEK